MLKTFVEIHCPKCGELKRLLKTKDQKKCPDCGSQQAIFLPAYSAQTQQAMLNRNIDVLRLNSGLEIEA